MEYSEEEIPDIVFAFFRYTYRIYHQLLLWTEVKEAIMRLRRWGMSEGGIIEKNDVSGQMRREMDHILLLGEFLKGVAAIAVKERYASTLGVKTTERYRVSFLVLCIVLSSRAVQCEPVGCGEAWNEGVMFSTIGGFLPTTTSKFTFEHILAVFCLGSDMKEGNFERRHPSSDMNFGKMTAFRTTPSAGSYG
jgi:hypothetical protein